MLPPELPARLKENPRVQTLSVEHRVMKIETVSMRFKI
jgi:hypothetical protein